MAPDSSVLPWPATEEGLEVTDALSAPPLFPSPWKTHQELAPSLWFPFPPLQSSQFCYHFKIKSWKHLLPIFQASGVGGSPI